MFVLRHVFPAAGDIAISQVRWWDYLNEKGFKGISTINQDIGADYTNIWYFIIVLFCKIGLYPTISLEVCIKLMAILGSIISGIAVYFIVKNFTQKESWKPAIAFCITLFSSTLFLDILKNKFTRFFIHSSSLIRVTCNYKTQTNYRLVFSRSCNAIQNDGDLYFATFRDVIYFRI